MERYLINGGRKLSGSVQIESAKNSVLPLLACSIMTDEQVIIEKCPKIQDVISMLEILATLGVRWRFEQENLVLNPSGINGFEITEELAKKLRSSVFMMGPLIARFKKAKLHFPGGCDIGLRPIDIHLKSLKSLGVSIVEQNGEIECTAKKIIGRAIYLDYPSVGATENAMMTAVLADGKTEIHNPAKEPEIIDLMKFLNSMGAKVYGAGTSTILIDGVKKLHGTTYKPISDRIEAGTFLIAGAITGGEVEIRNCQAKNIWSLIHKLCDNTCKIKVRNDIIYLKSGQSRKGFSFATGPYPFFPTDLQAQTTVLLAVSDGQSVVTENVFEMRYKYVEELLKMGADVSIRGRNAIINGVERLHGANVTACDLRGGAALVLAGLNAQGQTVVSDIRHVKRGYFNFDNKLASLGADITLKITD